MKASITCLILSALVSPLFSQDDILTWSEKMSLGLETTITSPALRSHWIITGFGVLAAFSFETELQDRRKDLMSNDLASYGDMWGGLLAASTILPTVYLAQAVKKAPREETRQRLEFTTLSLLSVGIYTSLLKTVTSRERPNGRGHMSFPSGHTSLSFGTAEVVRIFYGSHVGALYYGLALITGISRIHDNKHYLSDVIAGAGLGVGLVRGFDLALNRSKLSNNIQMSVSHGMLRIDLHLP